jgi:hypothetical protein
MKHSFRTGERVLFVNEDDRGTILMFIGDSKVKVLNSNGFEELIFLSDIIAFPNETYNKDSYGSSLKVNNEDEFTEKRNQKFLQFSNDKISQILFKADLHIENLVEHFHYLENFEIIQIQKNRCCNCISEAKQKDIPILHLIHGVGEGILKKEIHALLKRDGLKFFDEYGYTEVIIS